MDSNEDQLFCSQPFNRLEVHKGGKAFLCCPSWLPVSIGTLGESSLDEVWNGTQAQQIRASIHDGSFKFCDKKACPRFQNRNGTVQLASKVTDPRLKTIMGEKSLVLSQKPISLNCAYDPTCNLSCPSCRSKTTGLIPNSEKWRFTSKLQDSLIDILPELEWIKIAGDGDPFVSGIYSELLEKIDPQKHSNLKIFLLTNGTCLNSSRWQRLGDRTKLISRLEVSVDAADEVTYAKNRRGGVFSVLLENLTHLKSIREQGMNFTFVLTFVVQENNWRSMRNFVELGRRIGVDRMLFTKILDWNSMPQEEYKRRAVHLETHPDHQLFLKEIYSDFYSSPDVSLENLVYLRHPKASESESVKHIE